MKKGVGPHLKSVPPESMPEMGITLDSLWRAHTSESNWTGTRVQGLPLSAVIVFNLGNCCSNVGGQICYSNSNLLSQTKP